MTRTVSTPRLLLLGTLCILPVVACGDDEPTGPPDGSGPASVVAVAGGEEQSAEVGTAVPVDPTVEVRDASGAPLPDVTVEFSVGAGNGSTSPSSTTTDARGRASAVWVLGTDADADQRLDVTAGSASTAFTATAEPGPPEEVRIVSGDEQWTGASESVPDSLVVEVVDRYGNGVPDVPVRFSADGGTVSPEEVDTDEEGRAHAQASTGSEASLGAAAIVPDTLANPRETLRYERLLRVARSASFTAAAGPEESQLGSVSFTARVESSAEVSWSVVEGSPPSGITLSAEGELSGTPQATADSSHFVVGAEENGGESVTASFVLRVCEPPLNLTPGQRIAVDAPGTGACGIFLPSGAESRYRVGAIWPSSSEVPDTGSVDVQIRREEGSEAVAAPPPLAISTGTQRFSPFALPAAMLRREIARLEATEELHRRLREADRDLLRHTGAEALLPDRRSGAALVPSRAGAAPERREFNAPSIATTQESACTVEETLRGIRVLETERMVVYQDSAQRASNPVDSLLVRQMDEYYRDYGKPVIEDYFGGIPDIDANDRLVVLITPIPEEVSTQAAAFVLSRDLLTSEECAASNEAEITYFDAGVINAMQSDIGSFQALGSLVHEVKHISSLYNSIQRGAFQPGWIEEGTADIAGEVSSRLAWSDNGGPPPDERIAAADLGASGITRENFGVVIRLARTALTWSSQPNALTTDPLGAGDAHTFYGSSWHFHRFLGDAYFGGALADSSFFREQNDSTSAAGVDFLEGRLGTSFEALLEEHTVATMVNGSDVEDQVERRFASYAFPSAAEIFCAPNPLGVYPWPVTTTGTRVQGGCGEGGYDPTREEQTPWAGFVTESFEGAIGRGGMRIHDFVSEGTGQGIEINVDVEGPASGAVRVVVVRLE